MIKLAEFNYSTSERGWVLYLDASGNIKVDLSSDGSSSGKEYASNSGAYDDGTWQLGLFTYDGTVGNGELKIYDKTGNEVALTKTVDNTVNSLFDGSAYFDVGANNTKTGSNAEWNGELQRPFVWSGKVFSAEEVRDYIAYGTLPFTDSDKPDFLGYLDGTNCFDQSGNGNHLTAYNNPAQYTGKDVPRSPYDPDQAGWTDNSGMVVPAKLGSTTEDAQSNSLQYVGKAPVNGQLVNARCRTFNGTTQYATEAGLVGSETVVSSDGTSTPSISAGRIDFTAGTCFNLELSNGSTYAFSESTGDTVYDTSGNDRHLTLINNPAVATQDVFHWDHNKGFSRRMLFDGSDDNITLSSTLSEIDAGVDYSISLWIKSSDVVSTENILTHVSGASSRCTIISGSNEIIVGHWDGASYNSTSSGTIVADTLYHVVMLHHADNSTQLYVNAVEKLGTTGASASSTSGFKLGCDTDGTNDYSGLVYDVRVFDSILSESDISSLYAGNDVSGAVFRAIGKGNANDDWADQAGS